jgi:hypothetical protein
MANDIAIAVSGESVKNGSIVVSTTATGEYSVNDVSVKNTPTMSDIEDKYDNRFYNGIFVNITGSGIIGV